MFKISATRNTMNGKHQTSKSSEAFSTFNSSYNTFVSHPSDLLSRKIYGISNCLVSISSVDSLSILQNDPELGLDLNRIHVLQRDLVNFSNTLFEWITSTFCSHYKCPILFDSSTASAQSAVSKIYNYSIDFLLHLSCLAPIAPLNLSVDSPYSTSFTGIETLIQEATSLLALVGSKQSKSFITKLNSAADRAKSEQVSLIRCLIEQKSCLSQWAKHALQTAPILESLGNQHKNLMDSAVNEISILSNSIDQIVTSISDLRQEAKKLNLCFSLGVYSKRKCW
jgi:hypothetical protein